MLNFFSLICLFNLIYWMSTWALVFNRNDLILFLITIEISYLMLIMLFAISSSKIWGFVENQSYCLIFLVLAASDSATGLAILINSYLYVLKTSFTTYQLLHG